MSVSNVGNLMCLYMHEISPGKGTDAPEFCIKAAARALLESGSRNWVPVIVKEVSEDQYEVIGNGFVYAIAEEAGLERVWCVVTDASEKTLELTKILTGESVPKVNLSTASRDDIQAALRYLIEKPNSELKGVKLAIATNRIDEALRKSWKTFEPITKLKCGITKGKKLDALKEVFYLTPELTLEATIAEVATPEATTKVKLNTLSVTQLRDMAKTQGISGYNKKKKQELIALLSVG
ncbi:MAG: Rho termination factor N-terminal domain-containing protein [Chlorogloeopsis fritschii C42_A2020_084]|uniref:Rho termination factor N-terminal domain-containing protein n=1 Tax=Chlorogloeopsis fritschii TaxID=1124 RepID=UPI0019FA1313|nr:Rho termination factor N-terminal domain-containing protein [Chlorogloeopsis fritschii]MBF2008979.1 Rho termination factor N-terminal domain-containing protein [Chlorogloeopsis fritschii C42_A2020_084]